MGVGGEGRGTGSQIKDQSGAFPSAQLSESGFAAATAAAAAAAAPQRRGRRRRGREPRRVGRRRRRALLAHVKVARRRRQLDAQAVELLGGDDLAAEARAAVC